MLFVDNNVFNPNTGYVANGIKNSATMSKYVMEKAVDEGYTPEELHLALIAAGVIRAPDKLSDEAKATLNFSYEQIPGMGSLRAVKDAIKSGNPEDLVYAVMPILKSISSDDYDLNVYFPNEKEFFHCAFCYVLGQMTEIAQIILILKSAHLNGFVNINGFLS